MCLKIEYIIYFHQNYGEKTVMTSSMGSLERLHWTLAHGPLSQIPSFLEIIDKNPAPSPLIPTKVSPDNENNNKRYPNDWSRNILRP